MQIEDRIARLEKMLNVDDWGEEVRDMAGYTLDHNAIVHALLDHLGLEWEVDNEGVGRLLPTEQQAVEVSTNG